jgi:complement component 1 Q subcomponent-binding protein
VLIFPHPAFRFFTRLVADGSLSAKIAEELTYEKEAAVESEPDFLKEFKSAGIWTVCFL